MQSKTSFFNPTLFRKNLSRFWPLWGLGSFAGCIFPIALLLGLMHDTRTFSAVAGTVAPLDATENFYRVLVYAVPIISMVYAILCAVAVWSYLYNSRSAGLMHTLPVRRENLYITSVLSGMTMLLIPYAITGLLSILVVSAYGGFEPVGLLVTIGGVLGESLFFFALATLVAHVVGNVFALPLLYFLLNFLAVLLDWLVSIFAQGFLFGMSSSYSGVVEFLSPIVYLMTHVSVQTETEEILVAGQEWSEYHTIAVWLDKGWLIAVYAAVGVVLLVIAFLLYRRRASETAGDVVAVRVLRPVFQFGLAGLIALLGGRILYAFLWESFADSGEYFDVIPVAICMMIAGTIGYYAASMLLNKSVKVFRKSLPGLAVVLVSCAAVCAVLHFDVFRVEARVPAPEEIQQVELYAADNSYTLYAGEDDDLLAQVLGVHQAFVDDADYYQAGEDLTPDDVYQPYTRLEISYLLENGRELKREYRVRLNGERMAQPGTADNLLDALVNSRGMRLERLRCRDDRWSVSGGDLYVETSDESFDMNSREARSVLDAVARDANAGNWGDYNWMGDDDRDNYALNLGFELETAAGSGEDSRTRRDYINVFVTPAMTETVACLKSMGFVANGDLKTYGELYPQRYDHANDYSNYSEYYEKYGYDPDAMSAMPATEAALNATESSDAELNPNSFPSSVGVIGGADGPTSIYVG